jgi:hypothetical protein
MRVVAPVVSPVCRESWPAVSGPDSDGRLRQKKSGRGLSDLALQLLAAALAVTAGLAVGFRFHASALSCLAAAGLLVLISLSLFWLFAALGTL